MFSSLTPGKHSPLARSRAKSNACVGRKPQSPKHPIMILLRDLQISLLDEYSCKGNKSLDSPTTF